jgi:hypothetical protein
MSDYSYPDDVARKWKAERDAFETELNKVKKEYHEYKVYYDRIFARSIVVPTEEYGSMVDNITKLKHVAKVAKKSVKYCPAVEEHGTPEDCKIWQCSELREALADLDKK